MRMRLPVKPFLAALILAAWTLTATPALALTVAAPAQTRLVTDVRVTPDAEDGPGLGLLYVDGQLVRSMPLTPSVPATFTGVPLQPGAHQLRAIARTRGGLVYSPVIPVTAWPKPAPPALVAPLHAGLYPKASAFGVKLPAGTTKLSVLVNGKVAWAKAAKGPASFSIPLSLPSGVDTIELRSENPVECNARKFTVTRPTWPVPGHFGVTSDFGPRWGRMHKGIDIPGYYGCPIVAAAAGKVLWAEPLTTYGGLVMIDHGGGMTTYYAHLSSISVKIGQQVTMGQRVGSMGVASTAHLHFQLFTGADNANPDKFRRVNSGTPTDPYPYVAP